MMITLIMTDHDDHDDNIDYDEDHDDHDIDDYDDNIDYNGPLKWSGEERQVATRRRKDATIFMKFILEQGQI